MVERILDKVNSIIDYYGTRNPFELCEEMGIIVLKCDLPKSVNGIYTILHGQNTIILSSSLDDGIKRVVCSHELGHAILHNGLNCLDLEKNTNFSMPFFEKEADMFAACLIIDDNEVKKNICNNTLELHDISSLFSIPEYYVKLRYEIQ
ncbi:MAG: ImmA/IrrE family metallo-endopeptidase [Clostridia bacterium]|nr:ImmA/IrrE family metallo-endopeptidase [Clostridia bacterium]